ncbi:hypothetical protein [Amycolatopsis keratiniphila]|uniref:Tetratricopeptide repeat-containing protein n=1 Tax=Amycolatopsis keratiniphila subsp. keratiniphila TaxID=227715 RepID=A0A1W2M2L1_9PSEU|nr:hypothetical protein [Amycolatopsis keratiniphila]ONF74255.1 hypothetical protein AVR91_0202835 [Amycolatopsis keratiniphila subsp. keratiniphila]
MDTEEQLWRQIRVTDRMWEGPGQIAALEKVTRRVDALGLIAHRNEARVRLATAYLLGGEPAKAFEPLSLCLDSGDPELRPVFDHLAEAFVEDPRVPLADTLAVLDEGERLFGPMPDNRLIIASHLGTDADIGYEAPAESSRCGQCDTGLKIDHLLRIGRVDDAVELFSDDDYCSRQPHAMLAALMLPFARAGRLDDAVEAFRASYSAFWTEPAELGSLARHVEFCAHTGNHAAARKLVDRHGGWRPTPFGTMEFHAAAALVTDSHASLALEIAARFDARNGNSAQSRRIRASLAAEPAPVAVDLGSALLPRTKRMGSRLVIYPTTVEELASLAERNEDDPEFAAVMWERFDELLPNPEGELLARRRRAGSGGLAGATDPGASAFRRAALYLEEAPSRALTFARDAMDLFLAKFDYVNAARARLMAVWILAFTGDPKTALDLIDKPDPAGDNPEVQAEVLYTHGKLSQSFGDLDEAAFRLLMAAESFESAENTDALGWTRADLAELFLTMERFEDAADAAEEAVRLAPTARARALRNRAYLLRA